MPYHSTSSPKNMFSQDNFPGCFRAKARTSELKEKQQRQQEHARCKQSSVSVSQQSAALHLPRVCCDCGHLKTNKSILLFVRSCAPQRWAGFLCLSVCFLSLPPNLPLPSQGSLLCSSQFLVCLTPLYINSSINKHLRIKHQKSLFQTNGRLHENCFQLQMTFHNWSPHSEAVAFTHPSDSEHNPVIAWLFNYCVSDSLTS